MANEYWRAREEQALAEYQLTDDEYVKQLNDIYDYMVDQINREIRGFYSKYADAEGITMAEAAKRASELDMDEYSRKAKKYVAEQDFSTQANREMRLYNMTMKVNRLELLKSNIGLEMVNGFQDIEDLFGDSLTERAMDEFRRQAGILGNTVHDVARDADSIVGASFHNANWSDRIWMYQGMLRDELSTLLTQGMIQGRNPNELARHINNLFDAGKYNCERLMRTEMTRVQSDAQLQSFIANGFDEYQFNALGDACKDCAALDEQHFKIMDAVPGENLPPKHPNCRCAVSAWMDDASYNEWLDSYKDHGMSYEDWLENRPTAVDPYSGNALICSVAKNSGIESRTVQDLDSTLTSDQIIRKISGGDKSGGSCSSLALTYIANEHGMDVTDFRGGDSQAMFAEGTIIAQLADAGKGIVQTLENSVYDTMRFLTDNIEIGKTYYFAIGGHATVIQRMSYGSVNYLELQGNRANLNGWKHLDESVLVNRFGCERGKSDYARLIDSDTLASSPGFRETMSYINTAGNEQLKGRGGTTK